MNKQSRGLGRGLDALIPTMSEQEVVKELPINDIVANKYQPRNEFDEEALDELAESINQYGLLQPVIVRKILNGYELIAGERRLRASKQLGWDRVPCVVRTDVGSDRSRLELALLENIQRQDLNPLVEALALQRLLDEFSLSHEALAESLGRSRAAISNQLRLLRLSPALHVHVENGGLFLAPDPVDLRFKGTIAAARINFLPFNKII